MRPRQAGIWWCRRVECELSGSIVLIVILYLHRVVLSFCNANWLLAVFKIRQNRR